MSSFAPSFLTRFIRPFTASAFMGITSSSSFAAAPPMAIPEGAEKATVAAGCFWGVEHEYRKHFGRQGLYDARVGYIGGKTSEPSYRSVCAGTTGRAFCLPTCQQYLPT